MENKETNYSLTINMPDFVRYINESDEDFVKRVKLEGIKRVRYYLSGYLSDPDGKIITENVNITENKNQ
jgi:hypothetical protein